VIVVRPMPIQATLKPVRLEDKLRNKPWMLRVPPELSPSGMRMKLYFPTEAEAEIEANRLRSIRDEVRKAPEPIDGGLLVEATKAYEIIHRNDPDKTLLEAVREWEKRFQELNQGRTFRQIKEEWFADPKNAKRSDRHLTNVRQYFERFSILHNRAISDITRKDLAAVYSRFPDSSRNAAIRNLRPIFSHAVREGYIEKNPMMSHDKIDIPNSEVEIFDNATVKTYLNDVLEHDLDMLPYFALCTFAGIRPEEEMVLLKWSNVDWEEKTITVPAEVSKTHQGRDVPIPENALEWLNAYREKGGKLRGFMTPQLTREGIRNRRLKMVERTGIEWVTDGMRHSWASNWEKINRDIGQLRQLSGHRDVASLHKHYIRSVKQTDAEAFWQIRPKAV
jgi:integrase